MPESTRTYLPAAGHHWSLPLYDPIVKLLGGDKARRVLIDQAAIEAGVPTGRDFRLVGWKAGHRVLDIMLPQARGPRHARFWRAGVEAERQQKQYSSFSFATVLRS